jgi:uncharacterized protein with GYD domain
MPKYLSEISYTREGLAGVLKEGGSRRRTAAEEVAASIGATIECFYFSFGDRDVIVIGDYPDDEAAAATAMAINASGAAVVKTTVLLTPEQVDEAARRTVTYRPPAG